MPRTVAELIELADYPEVMCACGTERCPYKLLPELVKALRGQVADLEAAQQRLEDAENETGYLVLENLHEIVSCPGCDQGDSRIHEGTCPVCKGSGEVTGEEIAERVHEYEARLEAAQQRIEALEEVRRCATGLLRTAHRLRIGDAVVPLDNLWTTLWKTWRYALIEALATLEGGTEDGK